MYSFFLAIHIIFVIAWMAGLLYLPRLFVYHADAPTGSVQAETFKVMERRLLKAIMTPAMIASFIFGLWMLALNVELFSEPWFHVKFAVVFVLLCETHTQSGLKFNPVIFCAVPVPLYTPWSQCSLGKLPCAGSMFSSTGKLAVHIARKPEGGV